MITKRTYRYTKAVRPPFERAADMVVVAENGCWEFMGARSRGYGSVMSGSRTDGTRRMRLVHEIFYNELVGPVTPGLELDHLCVNRPCCNPDHLEPVTPYENKRRSGVWEDLPAMQSRMANARSSRWSI